MASLSGWIFVIIGGGVAIWSYFQPSLIFFTIVGAVMLLYGLSKIIYARAMKKSAPVQEKHASNNPRSQLHAQIQEYTNNPQTQHAMNLARQYSATGHPQTQHRTNHITPPQTHLPQQGRTAVVNQVHHQAQHAHLHQAQTAYRVCPNCKKQIHSGYRFCPHCGWGV